MVFQTAACQRYSLSAIMFSQYLCWKAAKVLQKNLIKVTQGLYSHEKSLKPWFVRHCRSARQINCSTNSVRGEKIKTLFGPDLIRCGNCVASVLEKLLRLNYKQIIQVLFCSLLSVFFFLSLQILNSGFKRTGESCAFEVARIDHKLSISFRSPDTVIRYWSWLCSSPLAFYSLCVAHMRLRGWKTSAVKATANGKKLHAQRVLLSGCCFPGRTTRSRRSADWRFLDFRILNKYQDFIFRPRSQAREKMSTKHVG